VPVIPPSTSGANVRVVSSQSAGLSSAWIVSNRIAQAVGRRNHSTIASAECRKTRPNATPPRTPISSNSAPWATAWSGMSQLPPANRLPIAAVIRQATTA
jgi:hypothetical protein